MLKIIIGVLTFCVILFMYLHIIFHLKTSEDLEIYEIDETTKEKIEEIFDLRQPVLFYFFNESIIHASKKSTIVERFSSSEIKIRNINETTEETELYVPLSIKVANNLFKEDNKGVYFSENNQDFLEVTEISKIFKMPYARRKRQYDRHCEH